MKKVDIDSDTLEIKPALYKRIGKNLSVEFDKCFDVDKTNLNTFIITKPAYSSKLNEICRYCNVFFKYYDAENEFITSLLFIKYQIDNKTIHYSMKQFMADIAEYLLSDSIIKKIFNMVEDYYMIDLSPTDDVKDVDLHALQFMNEHGKALMALSIAYKLTIPVVCHYYAIYNTQIYELRKARGEHELTIKDYLYQIFVSYFPLFQGDSNLFNKLAVTVNSHLTATKTSDKIMWNRARNKKITPTIYTDKLISIIVTDLLPKSIFSKNLIFLIQVAIPYQIRNTVFVPKDKYDYCDISMAIKTDELSGLEKMEANSARISDLDIIISSLNIKNTIKKIEKKYDIDISKDELDYYKEHTKSFVFSEIILQFFSSYFGGYYDLKSISKKNYLRLMIIFKHIMSDMGFIYIHQIMTGNISKTIKRRKVSSKQLAKIQNSHKFQTIMKTYSFGIGDTDNSIMRNIALLINTPVEYVDYSHPDRFGDNIIANVDIVADEYMRFIKMI